MVWDRYVEAARDALRRGLAQKAIEIAALGLNRGSSQALELRRLRARAYRKKGDWARAEREARHALELENDADVRALLAECLSRREQWSEASKHVDQALILAPHQGGWWILAATIRSGATHHDEAFAAIERAEELDPGSLDVLIAKAHVFKRAGRDGEMLSELQAATDANPDNLEAAVALGYAYAAVGRSEQAVAVLKGVLEETPDRHEIKYSLGTCLLRLGRFVEGWPYHEYRQPKAGEEMRRGIRPWRGESIASKHLLVWSEQGYGDTILFAGYVAHVRELAERVTTLVPRGLVELLRSNPDFGEVLPRDSHPPEADYQALIMSLPYCIDRGGGAGAAPPKHPFLFPKGELVEFWRRRLPDGPKICVAWQGNPNYPLDAARSMPIEHLAPLLEHFSEVQFISLQKNVGHEQLERLPKSLRPLDFDSQLDNGPDAFLDSLALLTLSDAFITTDTALAHLAGAAGIRTYLLLAHVADWRWGLRTTDTLWYPSVRLIRQPKPWDWPSAVDECASLLAEQLNPDQLQATWEGDRFAARHSKSKSLAT